MKNKENPFLKPGKANQPKKRLLLLVFFLFLLFSLLIIRYYQLQIIEGEKWVKEARKQHYFVVSEPFSRGTFYARKLQPPRKEQKLAYDIEKFHLHIDPASIPEKLKGKIGDILLRLLDIPKEDSPHFLRQFHIKSRSRKLAMWLEEEHKTVVLNWWRGFAKKHKIPKNALFFVSDYKRSYPFGALLGQVLHTIQDIKDEKTKSALPTGGLELYFNTYLKGKGGKHRLLRSPRNEIETKDIISTPENGADVYLTIDYTLQTIVEEELEKGVKKCKAKGGWAVMMDPYTGEILALAQYPFFYPSEYKKYFNDPLMIEHAKVRAVSDATEVGSVMKTITAAVALLANKELESRGEKPLFSPSEKIPTKSGSFPGRSKPITDGHPHAFLNMDMALQRSSNIYFGRLVERIIHRLGAAWYRDTLKNAFGFSLKTGIELPSESSGMLPTPGKLNSNGTLEWSAPTPYSMAFGYNLQATKLQVIRAVAVIANGGDLVKPTLIRKIMKGDETLFENSVNKTKVLDESMAKLIVNGMKYTTKTGGTCRKADVAGYTKAGKSSTTKKLLPNGIYSEKHYIGSFIGFAPAEHPVFILLVSMDEPEYGYVPGIGKVHNGGNCSSPVFKEVARRGLAYLEIPKDNPHGYPAGDPRFDPAKADWVLETERLNQLYQKWNP